MQFACVTSFIVPGLQLFPTYYHVLIRTYNGIDFALIHSWTSLAPKNASESIYVCVRTWIRTAMGAREKIAFDFEKPADKKSEYDNDE
jgi:hypothetical protein